MRKLVSLLLILAVFAVRSKGQSFDNFSNFQIAGQRVFWQNTYQVPDLSRDSVSQLIVSSFKTDNAFKLISKSEDEVIFEIVDKAMNKGRTKYSGKVIFQIKDGKCRATFSSIARHRDRLSTSAGYRRVGRYAIVSQTRYFDDYVTDRDKKYFREGKLQYLTGLNGKLYDLFDFRNRSLGVPLNTNW